MVFELDVVSAGFFVGSNKVNCAAPFNGGKRMVYGTDKGVYVSDVPVQAQPPVQVLALSNVQQVDVVEEHNWLIVLSKGRLLGFDNILDRDTPITNWKDCAKPLGQRTTFFRMGYCLDKAYVSAVKARTDCFRKSSEFHMYQPIAGPGNKYRTWAPRLSMWMQVKISNIHYTHDSRVTIGATGGFQIIDPSTLDATGLLNPADETLRLSYITARKSGAKPLAIYRIDSSFLLCYDELAFYINSDGYRFRPEFMLWWRGKPTGFALQYPYVLAFEPKFIEVRHLETGAVTQIIEGSKLRLLFADVSQYDQEGSGPGQCERDSIVLMSNNRVMTMRLAGPVDTAEEQPQTNGRS